MIFLFHKTYGIVLVWRDCSAARKQYLFLQNQRYTQQRRFAILWKSCFRISGLTLYVWKNLYQQVFPKTTGYTDNTYFLLISYFYSGFFLQFKSSHKCFTWNIYGSFISYNIINVSELYYFWLQILPLVFYL